MAELGCGEPAQQAEADGASVVSLRYAIPDAPPRGPRSDPPPGNDGPARDSDGQVAERPAGPALVALVPAPAAESGPVTTPAVGKAPGEEPSLLPVPAAVSPDGADQLEQAEQLEQVDRALAAARPAADEDSALHSLSSDFFERAPSMPAAQPHWDDDFEPPQMAHGSRRAMLATVAILGTSLAVIGGYLIYHKLVMPTPAELGGAVAYTLPVPSAPRGLPNPAPVEAARLRDHGALAMATPPSALSAGEVVSVTANDGPGELAGSEAGAVAAPVGQPEVGVVDTATGVVAAADAPAPAAVAPVTTAEVSTAPPDPSLEADDGFAQLLAEGARLADAGRSRDALRQLLQAQALRPGDAAVLAELAFVQLNEGKNSDAMALAERAVAADPTRSKAWIVLGAARGAKRDRKGARAAYERCAALPMDTFVRECKRLLH